MYRILPFGGYFFGLVVPLYVTRDYWSQFSPLTATMVSVGQAIALASLLLFGFLNWKNFRLSWSPTGALLSFGFVGWCTLSTIWSINPQETLINTVILTIYLTVISIAWNLPPQIFRRLALIGALATIAILIPLPFIIPFNNRTLGGITPNLFGHFAFMILVMFMIWGRFRFALAMISVIIIFIVQARTVFIGLVVFWIVWIYLSKFMKVASTRFDILIFLGFLGTAFGLIYIFAEISLTELVSSLLNVTTSSRLGANFTGRGDVWNVAYSKIMDNPIIGYGFKTRGVADLSYITDAINAHSGALNIALDLGLVGVALFFIWYAYAFWQAIDLRPHPFAQEKITIAAFLAGNVAILAVEPNYISFVHPTAFLTLLALSFPLVDFKLAKPAAPRRKFRRKPQPRLRYVRT